MLFPFLLAAASPLFSQSAPFLPLDELVGDWKNSKQFTIEVASRMPEEHYGFKPNPEQMSFGEQMVHIAVAQAFRFNQITGEKPPFGFDRPGKTDKASVLALLGHSFDYVIGVLPKVTPDQMTKVFKVDWKGRPEVNGRQMMMNMFMHTAHHRAQCEVYLRLKNIKPPDYRF